MSDQPSLAGPLARIERADELVGDLEVAIGEFVSRRPYTVEERPDDNPQGRTFVVTSLAEVPARACVIAGEIAHHLRASLDLLAYQLLLKAGVTDQRVLRKCSFPVFDHDLGTARGKADYAAALDRAIGPLPKPLKDRIEAIQPCATNHEWSHLAQVQLLDNTDKHRLLLAAASSTRVGGWVFRDEHGNETRMQHHSFVPMQVDSMIKVAPVPPGFALPTVARPRVAIRASPYAKYERHSEFVSETSDPGH